MIFGLHIDSLLIFKYYFILKTMWTNRVVIEKVRMPPIRCEC